MAKQPSFTMSKLWSAERILLVGSLLLLIDSFLPWQHLCVVRVCVRGSWNAWGGSGGFLGVLMSLCAIGLVLFVVASASGVASTLGTQATTIGSVLVAGTVFFGVLKFLFAVTHHSAIFAWFGLILLVVIAYGGYMRMQEPEARQAPPPTGGVSS